MDLNVRAFRTVQAALTESPSPNKLTERARKGGKKGGVARRESLSGERRREIAITANKARWKKQQSSS